MVGERNRAPAAGDARFSPDVSRNVRAQEYGAKGVIEGVRLIELPRFADDGGSLMELVRLKDGSASLPEGFTLRQVTASEVQPGAIKAWHLHRRQDDLWFVPPRDRLLVGLWDVREGSSTEGTTQRLVLGDGRSQLLFIPRGVAHGVSNPYPSAALMIYLLSEQFTKDDTDELRLPWDAKGADFWALRPG